MLLSNQHWRPGVFINKINKFPITRVLIYNNVPNIETVSYNIRKKYFENSLGYFQNNNHNVCIDRDDRDDRTSDTFDETANINSNFKQTIVDVRKSNNRKINIQLNPNKNKINLSQHYSYLKVDQ